MIDFKSEVLKIKDQMLQDIKDLCAIPSMQDDSTVALFAPYGAANRKALDAMLEIGRRDGFEVQDVDGHAGHIDIGSGEETLGILGHLDVVPVNEAGWDTNPFEVVIKDGKLDSVPLEDVVGNNKVVGAVSGNTPESNLRKVTMDDELVKTARAIGINLGD